MCNNCIHLSIDINDMVVRIVKVPLIIVVSRFESSGEYYYYWMDELVHRNPTDVGCWRIRYKN